MPALVIPNHIRQVGTESIGPVCKVLFVTEQNLGVDLRNVGFHDGSQAAVWFMFKGEPKASYFQ